MHPTACYQLTISAQTGDGVVELRLREFLSIPSSSCDPSGLLCGACSGNECLSVPTTIPTIGGPKTNGIQEPTVQSTTSVALPMETPETPLTSTQSADLTSPPDANSQDASSTSFFTPTSQDTIPSTTSHAVIRVTVTSTAPGAVTTQTQTFLVTPTTSSTSESSRVAASTIPSMHTTVMQSPRNLPFTIVAGAGAAFIVALIVGLIFWWRWRRKRGTPPGESASNMSESEYIHIIFFEVSYE